jgi:hypothetical protein
MEKSGMKMPSVGEIRRKLDDFAQLRNGERPMLPALHRNEVKKR